MTESVPTEKNINNKVKLYFQASKSESVTEARNVYSYFSIMKEKTELNSSSSIAIQGRTKTVYTHGGTNHTREDLEKKSGKQLVFRSKGNDRN